MFEWQVNEDEEVFAEPLEEWQPRRWRVNWRLLLAVTLGCVAVAVGVLRWRVAERERLMREDLTRFVTLEERSRLFGLRENFASLLVSNAPEEWAERYLGTFVEPDEARPVEMEVGRIEFRGENALATVLLDGVPQARRYRLTSQGWRRAPIRREDWSARDFLELRVGDDITLAFTPRDEAFARALMDDLPALTEEMAEWSAARSNTRLPERIQIQAVEFREPLMRSEEERVVLNSPLLVPASPTLSGEGAVRLALAHNLFGRAHTVEPEESGLPGRGRFIGAAHAVAAMRWALPPDEQARLRDAWRSSLDDEWGSPFFSGVRTGLRIDVVEPNRAEATALLAADYLYEKHGPEVLGDIAREAAVADSWDAIFLGRLGQYTAHLNAEVEAYARGGMEAANRVEVVAPAVTPVALPFDTDRVEPLPSSQSRFQVEVPGASEPILIHASGATISNPQGHPLPPPCISLYGDIRIHGDWIDVGRELQATRIETRGDIVPSLAADWTPAPPESIAYFITHQQGSIEAPPAQVIAALQPDGTMVPLGRFTDSGLISAVQRGETLQFAVSQHQAMCNHRSFGLYEPVSGLVSYWPTQPEVGGAFGGVLSRPDSPDLLTYTFEDGTIYRLLETGGSNRVTQLGRAEGFGYPRAWRPGTGEVVTINPEQSVFRFVDPVSGDLQRSLEVEGAPLWSLQLSTDGRYLSYLSAPGLPELGGQPDFGNATLHIYDLVEEREETLAFAGEQLFFWPIGAQSDRLPVVVGTVRDGDENWLPRGSRLLVVDPADPQNYVVADEVSDEEFIVYALNCVSGGILYTVMNDEGKDFEVRLWPSNGRPPVPVEAGDSSFPLACP